jgi:hypothetical protein
MKLTEQGLEARRAYYREYKNNMSPEAREKQKLYLKHWRAQNRERIRIYNCQYWEKKGRKLFGPVMPIKHSEQPLFTSISGKSNAQKELQTSIKY